MPLRRLRSLSHASLPSFFVMSFERPGLAQLIQRRGVTPFVQLTNLLGSPDASDHL